jgi:hypothetical protein
MNRLLEVWLFVNYCGQKIGQFSGADLKNSLLNVLVAQIAPLINIPIIFTYIYLGYRNYLIVVVLLVLVVWIIRIFLKNILKEHLFVSKLETKYKSISKNRKILNFALSILFTGGAIIIFGYSLFLLKWLK